jgi:tetratricopeptide (TPR) repeat protein
VQLYRKIGSVNKTKALQRAEKLVTSGKLVAAIEQYCQIIDDDPADITTANILGDLYVRAGMIPEAIYFFSRVADSYAENGFDLKAVAMSKKILKLNSNHLDTMLRLARLHLHNKEVNEARECFLQAADTYNRHGNTAKATEIYERVIKLEPSNTVVRMKLGAIYMHKGVPEKALESFMKAGDQFMSVGDADAAFNAYSKALIVRPHYRPAMQGIATIYRQRQQPERLINLLQQSLKIRPTDLEFLDLLGSTYLSAGLLDEAEQTFEKLFSLNEKAYLNLLELAEAFLKNGETARALKHLEACLNPLLARRQESTAIATLRAILKKEPGNLQALKQLYRIYLRINQTDKLSVTLNSIIKSALSTGATQEAIEALTNLIYLEPDNPSHRRWLADLQGNEAPEPEPVAGPAPAALLVNDLIPKFDYGSLMRYILKADSLIGSGHFDQAIAILKDILEIDPDNTEVRTKLKALYLHTGHVELAASQYLHLARIQQAHTRAFALAQSRQQALSALTLNDRQPPQSAAKLTEADWGFTCPATGEQSGARPDAISPTAFELVSNDERRKSARLPMNLPLVVGADDGGWKEVTETINVSETGLLFRAGRRVESGLNLRVGLPMPTHLRLFKDDGKLYKVQALVRHSVQLANGKNLIGIEFINKIFGK